MTTLSGSSASGLDAPTPRRGALATALAARSARFAASAPSASSPPRGASKNGSRAGARSSVVVANGLGSARKPCTARSSVHPGVKFKGVRWS
eukprot:29822-Pelagococcus_subviridis.AAC.3